MGRFRRNLMVRKWHYSVSKFAIRFTINLYFILIYKRIKLLVEYFCIKYLLYIKRRSHEQEFFTKKWAYTLVLRIYHSIMLFLKTYKNNLFTPNTRLALQLYQLPTSSSQNWILPIHLGVDLMTNAGVPQRTKLIPILFAKWLTILPWSLLLKPTNGICCW